MTAVFDSANFHQLCDELAEKDSDLQFIITNYGYPPMWSRKPVFSTLVLTILEQQVSLASAYAAYRKLKQKVGIITPAKILALTDSELRSCYFSRQKITYVRELAHAIQSKKLQLKNLTTKTNDEIRNELKKHKGIGDWTVDIYLIHVLHRTDLFPLGDIALINSLRATKNLLPHTSKEEMLIIAEPWKPYRTIATMLLWHAYIKKRNIKVLG